MNVMFTQLQKSQKGFSLIELLVSLSIFSIIIVASTGALLTLIDVNAKAQALYSATTNLSFALDSMTREIRMGYHYYCFNPNLVSGIPTQTNPVFNNCSDGSAISFFRERNDTQTGYRLMIIDGRGVLEQYDSGGWVPITSHREISITNFSLDVENAEPYEENFSDDDQPTVTLHITGTVNSGLSSETEFNIQTKIIQRRLDIK